MAGWQPETVKPAHKYGATALFANMARSRGARELTVAGLLPLNIAKSVTYQARIIWGEAAGLSMSVMASGNRLRSVVWKRVSKLCADKIAGVKIAKPSGENHRETIG